MNNEPEIKYQFERERPLSITFICLAGWVYTLIGLYLILLHPKASAEIFQTFGTVHPIITAIFNLIMLVAYVGIWKMKYWGVFLYSIVYVISSIYSAFIGTEWIWGYLPGLVILIVCLFNVRKMS